MISLARQFANFPSAECGLTSNVEDGSEEVITPSRDINSILQPCESSVPKIGPIQNTERIEHKHKREQSVVKLPKDFGLLFGGCNEIGILLNA